VAVVTAGAGGYGPPSGRAPERVAQDVAEGRLTAEEAQRIYARA